MELAAKIDELGKAWEEYKKINDQRLKEIESKGQARPDVEEKLAKAEKHIADLEQKIQGLNAAMNRTGGQGGAEDAEKTEAKARAEYRDALVKYIRKGADIPAELSRKALSVDSEVDGGFFVTPEMSNEIVKKVHESSPIRQLASVITISSASLKMNQDLDRPVASWVGERATRSASDTPQVRQIEIFAHEMDCNPSASQAFLDDAAINVEAWLGDYAAMAFALAEATAFVSGNGVGKPRGILSYADGTSFGYVQRIPTDATGAITGDDLIDVQQALKEPYQANASWLIHRTTLGTIRKIKENTTNQYIWQPGLQNNMPSQLLGRPVYMANDLNTALTTGTDGLAIYGDFRQGYQIVDRVGIRVLRDPYTSKPFVVFYTTKRVGGAVKNFEALKVLDIV